jgi:hypothetical protein
MRQEQEALNLRWSAPKFVGGFGALRRWCQIELWLVELMEKFNF